MNCFIFSTKLFSFDIIILFPILYVLLFPSCFESLKYLLFVENVLNLVSFWWNKTSHIPLWDKSTLKR